MSRVVALALGVLLLGCDPAATDPATLAQPSIDVDQLQPGFLMTAYLEALTSGDCNLAAAFAAPSLIKGNGQLCGSVHVRSYRITGGPKAVGDSEIVYGTELTTDGSADGSIPAGRVTWFWDLIKLPSGGWRVASGGSGP